MFGCGDGEPVLFLAREFPSARVRGVDPSAERVRAASARVGLDPEGRVAFKQSKPRRFPFPRRLLRPGRDLRGPPGGRRDRPCHASRGQPDPHLLPAHRPALKRPRAAMAKAPPPDRHLGWRNDGYRGNATDPAGQSCLGARADAEAAARGRAGARPAANSLPGRAHPRASRTGSSGRCGAVEAGEVPVVDQRRRPGRGDRRRDGGLGDPARDNSRRPRQRPRPRARHSRRSGRRRRRARRRRDAAASTSARPTASASSASSASASTPKQPTGERSQASCAATSSTSMPLFRTLLSWKPARFTIRSRERTDPHQRLLDLGRQQQHLRRWHADRARG